MWGQERGLFLSPFLSGWEEVQTVCLRESSCVEGTIDDVVGFRIVRCFGHKS